MLSKENNRGDHGLQINERGHGFLQKIAEDRFDKGERGQSNYQFLASFPGRPQQLGIFFNQRNTGNVSDPFGLMEEQNDKDRKEHDLSLV